MTKYIPLALFLFSLLTPLALPASPNVVVFLSDDQGWGDFSCTENPYIATPNLDQLAADGAFFQRFYVCPVCSPTRAEFLSGRAHRRSGVTSTSSGGERMNLAEATIAEAFKKGGYATAAFGKWHNGMQGPYHPLARGFDEYYGFCSGHWGHYFSPELEHNNKLVRGEGYVTDDFTNKAIAFVEKQVKAKKPFFCYLPYNTPHSPMQVPDAFYKKYTAKKYQELGTHNLAALAMCENIDANVGRLLKKLDELGVADDTIVVYFCDNGPNGKRFNGGMKGRKGSTDEGGVRSPLFVRWNGKIKKGLVIEQISSATDLLPTLTALAGVERVGKLPLDGKNLAPLLLGKEKDDPKTGHGRVIVNTWKGRFSVRTQQYRLDNKDNLFDIFADPGQTKNVASQHPDLVKKLKKMRDAWVKETESENQMGQPFDVGYVAAEDATPMPATFLPARDAMVTGAIKRSAKWPNCSYFTNWQNEEDTISWDVEVLTAGEYDVQLYYTCPKESVGVKMTLTSKATGAKVSKKITVVNDPPLVGAKEDRHYRGEGYVKDFKPVLLGTLPLKKGRTQLVLRAKGIQGGQAIDMRRIVLQKK